MGKPATLLEGLCGHALSFGAASILVERRERHEWVTASLGGQRVRIGKYLRSGRDGKELLGNLHAAVKKPVPAVFTGQVFILKVSVPDGSEEGAFAVSIDPAPRPDPSAPVSFTAKQGQYLAFIYRYSKVHRQAPAESDLQRYFQVSAPSVSGMTRILERNSLLERAPGQGRSIRLLVRPELLPALE